MYDNETNYVEIATELTIAWLSNPHNRVNAEDVPAFLSKMHSTVQGLGGNAAPTGEDAVSTKEYTPATTVRKSLASPDHIVSMIDGKPYKTLKRHLSTNGLTPAEYRERYGLKADYPMVAPTYSAARQDMARKIGLGRKPKVEGEGPSKAANPARKPSARDAAKAHLAGE